MFNWYLNSLVVYNIYIGWGSKYKFFGVSSLLIKKMLNFAPLKIKTIQDD